VTPTAYFSVAAKDMASGKSQSIRHHRFHALSENEPRSVWVWIETATAPEA